MVNNIKIKILATFLLVSISAFTAYAIVNHQNPSHSNVMLSESHPLEIVDAPTNSNSVEIETRPNNSMQVDSGATYIAKNNNDTGGTNYAFELNGIDRNKNDIRVGNQITLGDYEYTYGYTATGPDATIENGKLVPQDTGYTLGWHVQVVDDTKTTYAPMCEYIFGIPVTDMTYCYASCSNKTNHPEISRFIVFEEGSNW